MTVAALAGHTRGTPLPSLALPLTILASSISSFSSLRLFISAFPIPTLLHYTPRTRMQCPLRSRSLSSSSYPEAYSHCIVSHGLRGFYPSTRLPLSHTTPFIHFYTLTDLACPSLHAGSTLDIQVLSTAPTASSSSLSRSCFGILTSSTSQLRRLDSDLAVLSVAFQAPSRLFVAHLVRLISSSYPRRRRLFPSQSSIQRAAPCIHPPHFPLIPRFIYPIYAGLPGFYRIRDAVIQCLLLPFQHSVRANPISAFCLRPPSIFTPTLISILVDRSSTHPQPTFFFAHSPKTTFTLTYLRSRKHDIPEPNRRHSLIVARAEPVRP